MANEYGTNMTYAPDWERARASKAVSAVFLGELSVKCFGFFLIDHKNQLLFGLS